MDKSLIFLWDITKTGKVRYNNNEKSFMVIRRAISVWKGGTMSQSRNSTKSDDLERRTYTVDEIAHMLGIGRTSAYILVKEGHFKTVRIGNAIRISKRSFDEWLDTLDL